MLKIGLALLLLAAPVLAAQNHTTDASALAAHSYTAANAPELKGMALELATDHETRLAPGVFVSQLMPGLWVHTTVHKLDDGPLYPANGLLLETAKGSILFDPGWEPAQTEVLLDWAKNTLHKPVTRAIITHAHEDRILGVATLTKAGIPAYSLDLTAEIAAKRHLPATRVIPDLRTRPWIDPEGFEVYYPGPGHAQDNVVVYLPKQKVLYGGCFLKSSTSTSLGNLDDADVKAWPESLARLKARYSEARIVVPGHGTIAGDAIATTANLLTAKSARGRR
jgi:metallo-beta-lactamase class B